MQAKYDRVVTESDKLITGGARDREELNYLKGLSLMQLNRFKEARQVFEYMTERYRRGKRAFDAYIGIGDSYYMEGKYNDAVVAYNGALNNFPDHKNSAAVYHRLGNSYQKLGINGKANEYHSKVKSISPLSFESKMVSKDLSVATTAVAPGSQETEPGKPDEEGYYVQTGYFKAKTNADKLNEKLERKGYESYVVTVLKSNSAFYRVKVGRYKTKAEAEAEAKKLKKDGFVTKVCP
jgi:tetratricopeptide (TPR) repeat protein